MKSQVKNNINDTKKSNYVTNFKDNIINLFDLNKVKNKQKKIDFCRETGVSKGAVNTWLTKYMIPTKSNLKRIADYFNKWLDLDLTAEGLLEGSIIVTPNRVREDDARYLTSSEKKLIDKLRSLPKHKKETIEKLINDFE